MTEKINNESFSPREVMAELDKKLDYSIKEKKARKETAKGEILTADRAELDEAYEKYMAGNLEYKEAEKIFDKNIKSIIDLCEKDNINSTVKNLLMLSDKYPELMEPEKVEYTKKSKKVEVEEDRIINKLEIAMKSSVKEAFFTNRYEILNKVWEGYTNGKKI